MCLVLVSGFKNDRMASYVDSSFRQAIMKNPSERTQQVRRSNVSILANIVHFFKIIFFLIEFVVYQHLRDGLNCREISFFFCFFVVFFVCVPEKYFIVL